MLFPRVFPPPPPTHTFTPKLYCESPSSFYSPLPHLQSLPYCNTVARPLRNIRPPTAPFCMLFTIQYWRGVSDARGPVRIASLLRLCVSVYTCISIYTYIHAYIYSYISIGFTPIETQLYRYIHIHICIYMYIYIFIYLYIYIFIFMYLYIYIYVSISIPRVNP